VASITLLAFHLACLLVWVVGFSWVACLSGVVLYVVRMFGLSAGFHRGLAHRTYTTGRVVQFLLAWCGTMAGQRGPLWWVARHRQHHRDADTAQDIHSPVVYGFWWAHLGWVLGRRYDGTERAVVKDLMQYPELCWLDRYFLVPPMVLACGVFLVGLGLERWVPSWQTSAMHMLVYGFIISTTCLYHGTFTVNSFAHQFGRQRFPTGDASRNSYWVAVITLGEGFHNNHHWYPGSERQGFYWWEFDGSHCLLTVCKWLGLVWALRVPPPHVLGTPTQLLGRSHRAVTSSRRAK
jgi:stearoyl-CoA desaturase (delta-9 desaturase)